MGREIRCLFLAALLAGGLLPFCVWAGCDDPDDIAVRKEAYSLRVRLLGGAGKAQAFHSETEKYARQINRMAVSGANRKWALEQACHAFDRMAAIADSLLAESVGVSGKKKTPWRDVSPEDLASRHVQLFSHCEKNTACLDRVMMPYGEKMAELDARAMNGQLPPAAYLEALYALYAQMLDAAPAPKQRGFSLFGRR